MGPGPLLAARQGCDRHRSRARPGQRDGARARRGRRGHRRRRRRAARGGRRRRHGSRGSLRDPGAGPPGPDAGRRRGPDGLEPERVRGHQRAGQQRGHDQAGAGGGDLGRGLARGHRPEPDGAVLPRPGVRPPAASRRRAGKHHQRRVDELLPGRHGSAGVHRVEARSPRRHPRAGERMDRARDPGQRDRSRLDVDRPDGRPARGSRPRRGAAGPDADRALGRARRPRGRRGLPGLRRVALRLGHVHRRRRRLARC